MMTVPFGVGDCLYTGIDKKITYLHTIVNSADEKYFFDTYQRVQEALEWYKDNCIVSYNYLKKDFDELTTKIIISEKSTL